MGVEASTSKIDTININNGKVEGVAVGSEIAYNGSISFGVTPENGSV